MVTCFTVLSNFNLTFILHVRSFNEALFEPVQLTAFKKFLAERNAEVPIAFWQAVESMKTNCKDGKARLARASTIVRKFFINIPTSAG